MGNKNEGLKHKGWAPGVEAQAVPTSSLATAGVKLDVPSLAVKEVTSHLSLTTTVHDRAAEQRLRGQEARPVVMVSMMINMNLIVPTMVQEKKLN